MIRRTVHRPYMHATTACVVFAVSLAGCSGGGSSSDDVPVGELGSQLFEMESHRADVTLTEGSRALAPEVVDAAYLGRDGGLLRFRDDAEEISELETGMVVSLGSRGIRRIDGIERSGDELLLRTSPATMDQLIEETTAGL